MTLSDYALKLYDVETENHRDPEKRASKQPLSKYYYRKCPDQMKKITINIAYK
jgi:hypothetical protein